VAAIANEHPTRVGLVTIPGKLGRDLPVGLQRSILRLAFSEANVTIRSLAMSDTGAPSYLIVIERADDGGDGAWAPDLPGRVALGDSIEDAEGQMREAIAFHLEGLRQRASGSRHRPRSPRSW
jgi:predicted RNase H-like HicB family nuclease